MTRSPAALFAAALLGLAACAGTPPPDAVLAPPPPPDDEEAPPPPPPVTLSVVGTNDLHGRIAYLPVLGGYLANLRRARAADGGGVVLVDGGDMFQGTLESNLGEGEAVIAAYDVLGYTAATIGNHEFDYGPVGESPTPRQPGDDPRGALLARVAQARFPILSANLLEARTGERVRWPGVEPSALVEIAGVPVGVIGVTTEETLRTTIAANVSDLAMAPLAQTVTAEASALRERGALVVIVTAHAGGECQRFDDPEDTSSCVHEAEVFQLARALPERAVDAIVAGHTHQAVAHRVNGIPVIEAHAYGRAFGRVDLTVDRALGRVTRAELFRPRDLCTPHDAAPSACAPEDYEGGAVVPDEAVARAIAPAMAQAETLRGRALGVTLADTFTRAYRDESALGNLLADLMLRARPGADASLTTGGGVRADLPAGPLTYGSLYETFPFDNRFATVHLTGAELAAIVAGNLAEDRGVAILGGVRAEAACRDGRIEVRLTRANGRRIRDADRLTLVTSDFLATGGDDVFTALRQREGAVQVDADGPTIRDAMAEALGAMRGPLQPARYLDARRPRLRHTGRPMVCER